MPDLPAQRNLGDLQQTGVLEEGGGLGGGGLGLLDQPVEVDGDDPADVAGEAGPRARRCSTYSSTATTIASEPSW